MSGFLIDLTIASYYKFGNALTSNHGHSALVGVYGMRAVGFAFFGLRYRIPADKWFDQLAKISFWSLNIGLARMSLMTLPPLGVLQLSLGRPGHFHARPFEAHRQQHPTRCSSGCACRPTC
jgi:nitric oxide reductase subunit B